LRQALDGLADRGAKRVALCGAGEAAEVAYLTLRELGFEPVGVFAHDSVGQPFLGYTVHALADLASEDFDVVVVATFDRPEPILAQLGQLGVAPARIVTLRQPLGAVRQTG
jgi:NADPH-dependent 2,4-dienoyl-CoA reductase/sulfur reductase-like enzyme